MKKVLLWALLCIFVFLCGCSGKPVQEYIPSGVAEYFPNFRNQLRVFGGSGGEQASITQYAQFVQGNRMQMRFSDDGKIMDCVYTLQEDCVTLTNQYVDGARINHLEAQADLNAEIVLMAPLETGHSWQVKSGGIRTITAVDCEAVTPAGTFFAIETTTVYPSGRIQRSYYARQLGLVLYTIEEPGKITVTGKLKEIIHNTPEQIVCGFFFYSPQTQETLYEKRILQIATNETFGEVLKQQLGDAPNGCIAYSAEIAAPKVMVEAGTATVTLPKAYKNAIAPEDLQGALQAVSYTVMDYTRCSAVVFR